MAQRVPYCVGEWLPSDQVIFDQWAQKLIEELDKTVPSETSPGGKLHPVVQNFKDAIESNVELAIFFNQMFANIPTKHKNIPSQIRDYHHMLRLINHVITRAPECNDNMWAALPITAILFRPMGTIGGYAAFLNSKVNFHLKNILNAWGEFLKSPKSCYVLTTDGWFSATAMKRLGGNFEANFICDPSKPHYGFTSWDDFFTRELRPNARPVAYPDDHKVIISACEAAPFKVQMDVAQHATFWIKGEAYNLKFMLADDPLVDKFVGGTVYQAYLSESSYHRWHSPVDGKIVKAYVADGTYYSVPLIDSCENLTNPRTSQDYLVNVQTRALIFIEANHPCIGLMCFIAVGMTEVSSCEITINEGQRVQKGQQTGMFHYGGSTYCLIFQSGVELEFDFHGETPGITAKNILINSRIAAVLE
ncbi:uncharacterized protein [Dysidea avara]|uniref:uncharacterized protein n=1 Tax=Dysidea avara TaxID=196820 RepID=UPI00332485D5